MSVTSSLCPNPNNPRKIDDRRLSMLKSSLEFFGDLSGIVFNARTQQLVGGHQRIRVLPDDCDIQITHHYNPPTANGTTRDGYICVNGERFSFREVDWDETKEKAANLAANRSAGNFDMPAVADIFRDLRFLDVDMDHTMFDVSERETILSEGDFSPEDECLSRLDKKTPITCPSCGNSFVN